MSNRIDTQFIESKTIFQEGYQRVSDIINKHVILFLLGPAILVITAIFIYPVLSLIRRSFYLTVPGLPTQFAGLQNYSDMLSDPAFWDYFRHTLIYSFGSLILSLGSGLIIALALNHVIGQWIRTAYSTVLMFAWAIPIAVVAIIWKWIFTGNKLGFLNMLLVDLGILNQPYGWLSHQSITLFLVTAVDSWARMPFAMIVLLAGLQSIPAQMYDAAKVDGATTFQSFRAITLPHLRPYLAIVALMNWMFAFRAFAIIFPMTNGGPGTATTVFSIYLYRKGMINFNYGFAAAVSVFIIFISLIVSIFYVYNFIGGAQEV